mmetsp:Transcript_13193/g.34156  ORF Transcript_13193/g.34156 Transcript_13193/m.34156 type:complete len:417 (+) Transcript_13193:105-1355(+)
MLPRPGGRQEPKQWRASLHHVVLQLGGQAGDAAQDGGQPHGLQAARGLRGAAWRGLQPGRRGELPRRARRLGGLDDGARLLLALHGHRSGCGEVPQQLARQVLQEPGVLPDLADCQPLGGVRHEDAHEQVGAGGRDGDARREGVLHRRDALDRLGVVALVAGVLEGVAAKEHGVQQHAARPHVRLLSAVLDAALEHLGRDVRRRANRGLGLGVQVRRLAVPKIADLHARRRFLPVRVQQCVLQLEVPVADSHAVAVLQPANELLEKVARLRLLKAPPRGDALKQLPARRKLHHDRQVVLHQEDLVEADDVGVAQRAVVQDLPLHVLVHLASALDELHRHHLPRRLVLHQLGDAKVPAANILDHVILIRHCVWIPRTAGMSGRWKWAQAVAGAAAVGAAAIARSPLPARPAGRLRRG